MLLQKGVVLRVAPLHDRQVGAVEGFLQHRLERVVCRLGVLGGLEDDRIARRDGADDGAQREQDGIIPRGEDKGDTQRLRVDAEAGREEVQVAPALLGTDPLLQVADDVAYLMQDEANLRHVGLIGGLGEVFLQGCRYQLLVVFYGPVQLFQLQYAEAHVAGLVGVEESPLALHERAHFGVNPLLRELELNIPPVAEAGGRGRAVGV